MAIRSVHRYRRNSCQHEMYAKVGTKPYGVIYVTLETCRKKAKGQLVPGVKFKFRLKNAWFHELYTGVVADETTPDGTLFITLQ